jgi:hypothetical protein
VGGDQVELWGAIGFSEVGGVERRSRFSPFGLSTQI